LARTLSLRRVSAHYDTNSLARSGGSFLIQDPDEGRYGLLLARAPLHLVQPNGYVLTRGRLAPRWMA
jgi:hypothetical protein